MTASTELDGPDAVDAAIAAVDGWRGERMAQIRGWITDTDPEITETVKWRKPTNPLGVPTWEHHGILCTGEAYADKIKFTFASGAALQDPDGLFNSSLGGKVRRAIDIREDDEPDRDAFVALLREAMAHNER